MKLPRNIDGDELARLLNTGMDILLTTKRVVTSTCQQSFTGRPMILPFPVTNHFAWVHCTGSLRMLQNIRKFSFHR
jgi:hypothetical protein